MSRQFLTGLAVAALCLVSAGGARAREPAFAPQVNNAQGVKVTVTPRNVAKDVQTWDFEVAMETHTHPLDDALESSSVLIADGKQYPPSGWEGAPPGGHHRKGVLHFKAIAPQPASLELQIRLTGDPAPRSFEWRLK